VVVVVGVRGLPPSGRRELQAVGAGAAEGHTVQDPQDEGRVGAQGGGGPGVPEAHPEGGPHASPRLVAPRGSGLKQTGRW